jgi:C4-dicarboxylate transporter DctQ subunit
VKNRYSKIERIIDKSTETVMVYFGNSLLLLITLMIFVEVVSRYVFGVSHAMIEENCQIFFLWMVFLCAGKVTKEDKHISISLIPLLVEKTDNRRLIQAYNIILHLPTIVFAIILLLTGLLNVIQKKAAGAVSCFEYVFPYWIYHLSLPAGAVLLIYWEIRKIKDICYRKEVND